MIEKTILNYLISENLPGIANNIFMEVPSNPPSKYIVIEKTGGGEDDLLNNPAIAIQSISKNSLYEAAEINEQIKESMKSMPESQDVYGVKLQSDYNFTNPATKEYRYQAVFLITY